MYSLFDVYFLLREGTRPEIEENGSRGQSVICQKAKMTCIPMKVTHVIQNESSPTVSRRSLRKSVLSFQVGLFGEKIILYTRGNAFT